MMTLTAMEHDISTPAAREKFFMCLYESAFPVVGKFVSSRGGTFQDAKDIFQDALVIFYEKTREGNLSVEVSDEAYVLGIAKHLWIRKFNHDKSTVPLDEREAVTLPDHYFPTVESGKLVSFLARAGKRCMELLQAFYYEKRSADQIRNAFGYGSAHSATVQKFKCLEKVRDMVRSKSVTYEDFTE
ncbi:sigma-70 family RNA polymerase sigma factor [Fulvivirgaceae bacterium PWU4]|uniref:Sigma-70 family RNA polymerase sigma factor n=1 Tax=Chryseosolibacter histidini TaxID=2782349 RepID=A0AAP2DJ39_9BACT|nr:sigma-70 family RNA polymerase sigma factor [Chryseosolibacter histidini]MBT1697293.1 sigma-70 family RNA polymerase sigma factor [Chryseosolibacter histidini]